MRNYFAKITIQQKSYQVEISSWGEGSIPILIIGHAEIYGKILEKCYRDHENGLYLKQYRFFIPHYWCTGSAIAALPDEVLNSWSWGDYIRHIEELRRGLEKQGLLSATRNKVGIYSHSGFFILAALYGISYPDQVLFIEAEGPPPCFTTEWPKEKALFFQGNASPERKEALAAQHLQAHQSAVDQKNMENFSSYIQAYYKMAPTLFLNFKRDYFDYKKKVWDSFEVNMAMLRRYFQLTADVNCLKLLKRLDCPVYLIFGGLDTAAPYYIWVDLIQKEKMTNVDYYVHIEAAHWPYLETWEKAVQSKPYRKNEVIEQKQNFINNKIMPLLPKYDQPTLLFKSKL